MESNYDKDETEFLLDGFTNGFGIGYSGPKDVKITSPNQKFSGIGDKYTLWNKVIKEVEAERYAWPFEDIPFDNYIKSPKGLVPKDRGKDTRLIFHLSYCRGKSLSINVNTSVELCKVKYPDFNDAIQREGRFCHTAK